MGFITHRLTPRPVRRAMHPIRSTVSDMERKRKASNRKASAAAKRKTIWAAPQAPITPITAEDDRRGKVLLALICGSIVAVFLTLCIVWGVLPTIVFLILAAFVIGKALS